MPVTTAGTATSFFGSRRTGFGFLALVAAFLSFTGCDRDIIVFRTPEGVALNANRLEVQVRVHSSSPTPDSAWVGGIPSARVSALLVRDHKETITETAASDLAGAAAISLEQHPAGTYWVAAERRIGLDSAAAAGLLIPVLAGGIKVSVRGVTADTIVARPAQRGTLLISEVSFNAPPPWELNDYPGEASAYVEIVNNGDAAVHLDGMLLGQMYSSWRDYEEFGHHRCEETEPMRNDPEGIWSTFIFRFPGEGADHPVEPGARVVVPVSATDHSVVHTALPDLSQADFEFLVGRGLADNPQAPNLSDVGPTPATHHIFFGTSFGWYLADPLDLDALPRKTDPGSYFGNMYDYVRIPAPAIRDATIIWWDNSKAYTATGSSPICPEPVHASFDAIPGGFLEGSSNPQRWSWSAHRRTIEGVDGRMYGLDTDVSAVDFFQAPMTPGGPPPDG